VIEVEEEKEVEEEQTVDVIEVKEVPSEKLRKFDFRKVVIPMPSLPEHGDFVVLKAVLITVDPTAALMEHQVVAQAQSVDDTVAPVIGMIVEARETCMYKSGDFVLCKMGWKLFSIEPTQTCKMVLSAAELALQTEEQKASHGKRSRALGVMGPPGQNAYFGLFHKGEAQVGKTMFVSGASSTCGAIIGMMSKADNDKSKHLYLYASCREERDIPYLMEINKFDKLVCRQGINDDSVYAKKAFRALGGKRIDMFIDNTGGIIAAGVMQLLKPSARIVILGQSDAASYPFNYATAILKAGCRASGLRLGDYARLIEDEFEPVVGNWEDNKKVKLKTTTVIGFGVLPVTLIKQRTAEIRGNVECMIEQQKKH